MEEMEQIVTVRNKGVHERNAGVNKTTLQEDFKVPLNQQNSELELSLNDGLENIDEQYLKYGDKKTNTSVDDLCFSLSEKIFLVEKRLEAKINKVNDLCSRLSVKIFPEENEVNVNLKKKEDTIKDLSMMHNSYIAELFTFISLPGVRYITGRRDSKFHRLLWAFMHFAALLISAYYIRNAYFSWQDSPVVQGLKNTLTKVKEIPFPSVTICEPIIIKEEYNYWFKILGKGCSEENELDCSEDKWKIFMDFPFSRDNIQFHGLYNRPKNKIVLDQTFSGKEYFQYIKNLSLECEKVNQLKISQYANDTIRLCYESISPPVLLYESNSNRFTVCQTYNGIRHGPQYRATEEIGHDTIKDGFEKLSMCSPENMLDSFCKSVLTYTDHNLVITFLGSYDVASQYYDGKEIFIIIHNPADYPTFKNMKYYSIPRDNVGRFSINPILIDAAKDLSTVDMAKRGCVFSFEKKLSLFRFYTYQNCLFECQINCALATCGCIPYTLTVFNSSLMFCSSSVADACNYMSCQCECPPDCVSLRYGVEKEIKPNILSQNLYTQVEIRFKELEFQSTYRYSVTSPAEFVAYSLGILGVFNGLSVLLVWEILYWLTLRLWSIVCRTLLMITPTSNKDTVSV